MLPEVLTGTLDRITGQLDMLTRTMSILEQRVCLTEDRIAAMIQAQDEQRLQGMPQPVMGAYEENGYGYGGQAPSDP